ncbi:hypothetical protein EDC04DRAFT_2614214 [Pisolithus marmoratus]|nr:hypothetical protein EDC04DRAFT_2614214 [Pisolithus marmoratus]
MASKRKTQQVSISESDDAYVMVDSFGEDEEIPTLPTFFRPLHIHPVSQAACGRSRTVTTSNGTHSTILGQNTSELSNDMEEIPITRSDLQLFKETIQLELDGAIDAINEAANTMKAHLVGTSLSAHGSTRHEEKPPSLQGRHRKLIREHTLALMKRENKHSPFTNVPNRAEVMSYTKGTQHPCCTADNFHVDLNDTPASAWNTSVSHVFAASFHDTHPGCDRSLKAIFDAWIVHFNYLCQVYAKQQMVAHAEQARALDLASRCRERKLQLYNCCLRMAHRHSESYPSAVNVVQQLRPTDTMHMLDKLHLRMRYQQQWNATAGAWPHLHMPSSQVSNRKPLSGLPKNFYAQDYLSSLTSEGLDNLLLQEDIPLDIPQAIAALAGPYDVFDRQTALSSAGRCS